MSGGELNYTVVELQIELANAGHLLAWVGPALRGLVAMELKQRYCLLAEPERSERRYCDGCQYQRECCYATLFEPALDGIGKVLPCGESSARPVVLAPAFPAAERVRSGDRLGLRIVTVGAGCQQCAEELLEALDRVGCGQGLGPDHVRFRIDRGRGARRVQSGLLAQRDLPCRLSDLPGSVARLAVGLNSPLILRRRESDGRRRTVLRPELYELFGAAERTVRQLLGRYGQGEEMYLSELRQAARSVRMIDHCYERFEQRKWSSRTEQRIEVRGVVGGAMYRDVPWALVPWLYWGGLFHVATHRVCGAGGWRLVLC